MCNWHGVFAVEESSSYRSPAIKELHMNRAGFVSSSLTPMLDDAFSWLNLNSGSSRTIAGLAVEDVYNCCSYKEAIIRESHVKHLQLVIFELTHACAQVSNPHDEDLDSPVLD